MHFTRKSGTSKLLVLDLANFFCFRHLAGVHDLEILRLRTSRIWAGNPSYERETCDTYQLSTCSTLTSPVFSLDSRTRQLSFTQSE